MTGGWRSLSLQNARSSSYSINGLEHLVGFGSCFAPVVVVEGIETTFQADRARAAGATHPQGYSFSRPLAFDAGDLSRFAMGVPISGKISSDHRIARRSDLHNMERATDGARSGRIIGTCAIVFSAAACGFLLAGKVQTSIAIIASAALAGWLGRKAQQLVECCSAVARSPSPYSAPRNFGREGPPLRPFPLRAFGQRQSEIAKTLSFQSARLTVLQTDLEKMLLHAGRLDPDVSLILRETLGHTKLEVENIGEITAGSQTGHCICASETPWSATIFAGADKEHFFNHLVQVSSRNRPGRRRQEPPAPSSKTFNSIVRTAGNGSPPGQR